MKKNLQQERRNLEFNELAGCRGGDDPYFGDMMGVPGCDPVADCIRRIPGIMMQSSDKFIPSVSGRTDCGHGPELIRIPNGATRRTGYEKIRNSLPKVPNWKMDAAEF